MASKRFGHGRTAAKSKIWWMLFMAHFLWDYNVRFNETNQKICSYLYAIEKRENVSKSSSCVSLRLSHKSYIPKISYGVTAHKDRVTEGQNPMILKSFFLQFKLIPITRQKWMSYFSISTSIFYYFLPSQDWTPVTAYPTTTVSFKFLWF